MTNIRPSSTFLSVPRYTTSYLIGEDANYYTSIKKPMVDPDRVESEIAHFDSEKAQRNIAVTEKSKIQKALGDMYNNTIPFSPNQKNFLMTPKDRRNEVSLFHIYRYDSALGKRNERETFSVYRS